MSDEDVVRMDSMKLDKDRAKYLIETVVASLRYDFRERFYNFLQVLEEEDNPVVKVVAKDMRSQLEPSMPPQLSGGLVHPSHQGHSMMTPGPHQGRPILQPFVGKLLTLSGDKIC